METKINDKNILVQQFVLTSTLSLHIKVYFISGYFAYFSQTCLWSKRFI